MAKLQRIRRHERTLPNLLKNMPLEHIPNKGWFKQMSRKVMNSADILEYQADLLPGKHYIICTKNERLLFVHRATGRFISLRDVELNNMKLTDNNVTILNLLRNTNAVFEVNVNWIQNIDVNERGGIKLEYDILNIVQPLDQDKLQNIEYLNEKTGNKLVFRRKNINEWYKNKIIDETYRAQALEYRNWTDIPEGEYVIWGCLMKKLFEENILIFIMMDMKGNYWYSKLNFLFPLLTLQIDGTMSFTEALLRDDITVQVFWDKSERNMEIIAINRLKNIHARRVGLNDDDGNCMLTTSIDASG